MVFARAEQAVGVAVRQDGDAQRERDAAPAEGDDSGRGRLQDPGELLARPPGGDPGLVIAPRRRRPTLTAVLAAAVVGALLFCGGLLTGRAMGDPAVLPGSGPGMGWQPSGQDGAGDGQGDGRGWSGENGQEGGPAFGGRGEQGFGREGDGGSGVGGSGPAEDGANGDSGAASE